MNIFVLNRGSSSIKCYVYALSEAPKHYVPPQWEARVQWKGDFEEPELKVKDASGTQHVEASAYKNAKEALAHVMQLLGDRLPIDAIGHRIVHGGTWFEESVRITKDVKEKIRELSDLAPLHNLPELEGIEILEELVDAPQIAVFDTAFHHTLPQAAHIYPGPYRWVEEGIRRYGFHGISYQYCSRRAAELLGRDPKAVICHLGSGASLCAVKEGKSVDTTMGFTPLEGLMMDTRSGSIDPGIILHMLKKRSVQEIADELYKKSGLVGVSGISSDMRDIIEKSAQKEGRAYLALDVYLHRLNALIGSMVASLGGIDALIFTAGIGENAPLIRAKACEAFAFLGLKLDAALNESHPREDAILSAADSQVQVLLIHTQEAFEIARECWRLVG